jgi:hypothetical protein
MASASRTIPNPEATMKNTVLPANAIIPPPARKQTNEIRSL